MYYGVQSDRVDIEKIVRKISLLHSVSTETPTSFELARELVNQIDVDWANPNLKVLDPGCGRGTFLLAVLEKLDQYHTREHAVTNMLYGVDVSKVQASIARKALNLCSGVETNISTDDTLKKAWNMKFDVILGNPPYNWSDGEKQRKNNRENLWTRFITKSFEDLVADDGYVAMVVPKTWMSPSKDYGTTSIMNDYFKPNQVEVINVDDCAKHFNVGSSFSYFIVKKDGSNSSNSTKVITPVDSFDINMNDSAWNMGIPSVLNKDIFTTVSKFFDTSHEKFPWKNQYEGQVDNFRSTSGYKVFHTPASVGKTFSPEKSYLHTKKKVMVSLSGKYVPYYDNGDCSPSGMVVCLLLKENETIDNARSVLDSKLYKIMVDVVFRYNGWINGNVLKALPALDLTRSWTDDEIYDHFELSKSERNAIN